METTKDELVSTKEREHLLLSTVNNFQGFQLLLTLLPQIKRKQLTLF